MRCVVSASCPLLFATAKGVLLGVVVGALAI